MYVTTDVYEIYNWLLEDLGMTVLPKVPKEQRCLEYEDVYPLLYLKHRLSSGTQRRTIRHLVIDEMQDYSYLQYVILRQMFSCNMTILGDRAQTLDETRRDVLKFLPKIFGRQVRKIEMKKSYRNTLEIAKYAETIGRINDIVYLERHGKEVEEQNFSCREQALDYILEIWEAAEEFETAAVLVMTEQEARECYAYLKDSSGSMQLSYIDRDSTVFHKGITVTTFYQAKGLEFDQVFLLGGDRKNAFFRQFRYIGATRALHELYVCEY